MKRKGLGKYKINEDLIGRLKDRKDISPLDKHLDKIIKTAQKKNYFEDIFKKYDFEIGEVYGDVDSGTLSLHAKGTNGEAGMDIFFNVEEDGITFSLNPYDFVEFDTEEPFTAYNKVLNAIFGDDAKDFYQKGDFDKIVAKVREYAGNSVADEVEEKLEEYFEEHYDEILDITKTSVSESIYNVYNPQEEAEEQKYGRQVNRSNFTSEDLRNQFIGSLNWPTTNAQAFWNSLRDAIDKMPDEWVAEFLRVQNGDVVELVNESIEPKQISEDITITVNRKEIHSLLSFCSMLINALAGDYVTKYTAEKYSKIIDKLDDQIG